MRIGIMTFWESYDNYGQLFQCWALQQYLKSKGYSPYLIRYHRERSCRKRGLCMCIDAIKDIIKKCNSKSWQRGFSEFRRDHLIVSEKEYNSLLDLRRDPPTADVYITGSDQVWNYEMSANDRKAFLLQFGDNGIKRISYAPSIGHLSYEPSLLGELQLSLSRFDAISVREKSSIDIIENIGLNAVQVLDPTLLLSSEEYSTLLYNNRRITKSPFIFIYSLNYVSTKDLPFEEIKEYAKDMNHEIVVTAGTGLHRCRKLFKNVTYCFAKPSEWISNIIKSEIVVTASFHGVVFCILFHKKFLYTPLMGEWNGTLVPKGGNDRILDLLNKLDLNSCIYDRTLSFQNYVDIDIDWDIVDDHLNRYRNISNDFLSRNLC